MIGTVEAFVISTRDDVVREAIDDGLRKVIKRRTNLIPYREDKNRIFITRDVYIKYKKVKES